jgi:hypothetical protein
MFPLVTPAHTVSVMVVSVEAQHAIVGVAYTLLGGAGVGIAKAGPTGTIDVGAGVTATGGAPAELLRRSVPATVAVQATRANRGRVLRTAMESPWDSIGHSGS